MTATESEFIILVDEADKEIGIAEKISAHKNNQLHRAFSVFVFRMINKKWELLLQQRGLHKYHSAGLWTNTCCSHPRQGEDIVSAGERRLKEELGMSSSLKDLGWFHYNAHFANGLSENVIDHVLVGIVAADVSVSPHPDEIHAYRWMEVDDVQQELDQHPEKFTPWLQQALSKASAYIKKI